MTLLLSILGAALYRWRGHASKYKKYFPRPFNQIAFALPYAYVVYAAGAHWAVVLGVLALSTLGVLTGHGKFFDLGKWTLPAEDETLEFTIKWLEGKIPNYWYDFLGLAVTGIAVSLPAGLVTLNPLLALSGALKAPAYAIGHLVSNQRPTEVGEWLTGAFLWGSLVAIAF